MDLPSIPRPPGTPIPATPQSDEPPPFYPPADVSHLVPTDSRRSSVAFDSQRSSVVFDSRRSSVAFLDLYGTPPASPRFAPGPPRSDSPVAWDSAGAASSGGSSAAGGSSPAINPMRKPPFNFQPTLASKGPVQSKPSQRRGHRYKHSSVSHQIFLEPPPRAPLSLPASLPVPNFLECLSSITPSQRLRTIWCFTHILIAAFVLWSAAGCLALTALSHVILFDALGASVCVVVDVLSNFEVWKRSTIRHPFGLERAEVLAGFAMSVFLLFMGFDIITHTAEHLLEGFRTFSDIEGEAGAVPHDHHSHHSRVSPGSIDLASLLAITSTLISALLLKNHARIGRAMRIPTSSFLQNTLFAHTPSHVLTLLFATILLILPLLSVTYYSWLDRFLAIAIAVCMLVMGARLIKSLGSMLLMSYYPADGGGVVIESLVRELERSCGSVKRVVECKVWQVHYGLGMVGLKVVLDAEGLGEEGRVRERIGKVVKDRLGTGLAMGRAGGGLRWEVSVAIVSDS